MAWMYDHHIEWNAGVRFDERLAYTA